MSADLLVVGSGLYGLTVARRAAEAGHNVTVVEKRPHPGGNAWSYQLSNGTEVHPYGAHIFHTSNQRVVEFLSRFTTWTPYEHRVKTLHEGAIYPLPFNLTLMSQFYGTPLTPGEARDLIRNATEGLDPKAATNLEERAVALIGRDLYEAFVRDYTRKQWETDPRDLPASVISRLPVRYTHDDRYFSDTFQAMPTDGYGAMIKRMLDHPRITLHLGVDYFDRLRETTAGTPTVYTGPVDRFFDYAEGRLGWRTIELDWETVHMDDGQGTAVINYADANTPYTRTIEFRHFHPERTYTDDRTLLAHERSRLAGEGDEPFYPVNTVRDRWMLNRYRERIAYEQHVTFGGRLGSYQYLDMHMAVASALGAADRMEF